MVCGKGNLHDADNILSLWISKYSAKPKGMRLGYMGHLTFIADEIIKLFEGYPEAVLSQVKDDIDLESWNAYCNNELKETKERDRLPLAGPRPNDGLDGAATDEEDEEPMDGVTARQVCDRSDEIMLYTSLLVY